MRDPEVEAALAALLASVDSKMASSFKVKDEILDAIHDIDIEIKFHRQEGGEQIVALADLLTQRADLQCRARLYQEAEISLREALSIRESSCGPDHYSVSTDLANLARVYHVQELYDEAEPLLKRAILLRKKLVGSEHLKVGELERQYAKLLRRMNRLIEAEAVEMHVAKIYS
jgi:tetratricopeptide (TPR) repeat protein